MQEYGTPPHPFPRGEGGGLFFVWSDAYIHFLRGNFRRADVLFLRFCTMLFFMHLERQKIQGTYFKICALYFKIYGLYFLQHALYFFEHAFGIKKMWHYFVSLCACRRSYCRYNPAKMVPERECHAQLMAHGSTASG